MIYRIINHNFYSTIFVIIIIVLMVGFGCQKTTNNEQSIMNDDNTVETRFGESGRNSKFEVRSSIISTKFVDSYEFANTNAIDAKFVNGYLVAGIVNHHSLAMDLQARFFKSLKDSRLGIDRFIIISPDHFMAGDLVSTHGFAYSTPAGEVESLALDVSGIYQAKDVKVFANEHGVGALAPFIAREFLGAVVTPVYIRPETTPAQLQKIGREIAKQINEKTFVILSSDMSHYLPDSEARENDEMTLSWIEDKDWEKLESATDDYTDSAQGFVVLEAMFASLKQDIDFELLDHAVSTDYGADPNDTTSYINGFYIIADSR